MNNNEYQQNSRREFLKSTGALAAGAAAVGLLAKPNLVLGQVKGANERVRVGVAGLSRGRGHIKGYLDVPNTEVAYVCDVDSKRLASGFKTMEGKQPHPAKKITDYRVMLDDKDLDAISIATPNFWHAPMTIQACQAGKHVYVEKPGSYNPYEAYKMVEVAKATDRKVQLGTQRRSYPGNIEGIQKLREGIIGKTLYARCWYSNKRGSIGKGKLVDPPADLDWALWQGPLVEKPYKDNLVHYNWHWHWYYGGGELANNGPHFLDIARWAMDVDYPERVTCEGGRYHFDDDQETPDTFNVSYDFGAKGGITMAVSSCHQRKPDKLTFLSVYGEGGKMDFTGANYNVYDLGGKLIGENKDKAGDVPHFTNFVNAIRNDEALNQEIGNGQISTMLCHYGNIAYRTTGALQVDSKSGHLQAGQEAAQKLWQRESYRKGWEI